MAVKEEPKGVLSLHFYTTFDQKSPFYHQVSSPIDYAIRILIGLCSSSVKCQSPSDLVFRLGEIALIRFKCSITCVVSEINSNLVFLVFGSR
ncbi:hypothetical protein L1987_79195 [Smallanthus sonchifolius]|uniref:Uncharacterized protein n=1 Tax=Smallanthus sonchifolius TaxID=185202 RepID=A0ACB8ZER0_9ASTR|nr:hypothetical protein L1987_79195 [Smallanthus sonchifolius]